MLEQNCWSEVKFLFCKIIETKLNVLRSKGGYGHVERMNVIVLVMFEEMNVIVSKRMICFKLEIVLCSKSFQLIPTNRGFWNDYLFIMIIDLLINKIWIWTQR